MRNNIPLAFLAAVALAAACQHTFAAEATETGRDSTKIGECSLIVDGTIKVGDSLKIARILEGWHARQPNAPYASEFDGLDYIVCISGKRGDYHEAIKIAEVFAAKMVATSVPVGAECSGACAIAFLGGRDCCIEGGRTLMKRHLSKGAVLGLGAPTFESDGENYSAGDLSDEFERSLKVITELQSRAVTIGISAAIIEKILSNRDGGMHFIRPDPAHQHNYVDENGNVFQDIWVPGISGVVNQGTLDQ